MHLVLVSFGKLVVYRIFQVFESPASFTLPRETITISGFADLITCCGHTTEIMVNIKDQQYLTQNCQNLVHKFLSVTLRSFRQGIFPQNLGNISIITFRLLLDIGTE